MASKAMVRNMAHVNSHIAEAEGGHGRSRADSSSSVSPSANIRKYLKDPRLRIAPDLLFQRLVFEAKLRYALIKMATFTAYLVCFFLMLQSILPSDQASVARQHLEAVLGTADVGSVSSPDGVLTFAAGVASALQGRRATADAYWCNAQHLSVQWDPATEATKRVCLAPHGTPLGYPDVEPWVSGRRLDEEQGAMGDLHVSRRLAASTTATTSTTSTKRVTSTTITTTTSTSTTTTSECIDKDLLLAGFLNEPGATCSAKNASVCSLDIGAAYCSSTCGLCPPFRYKRLKEFIGPGVAIAPLVVYQTRFASRSCDAWIQGRQNMMATANPHFADSSTSTAGVRGASLDMAACVDRTKQQTSWGNFSSRSYNGDTVYAQMLLRPDVDLRRMQALEWLDAFTDRAALLALVYTEGTEIFTLLSVEFSFDFAGNVESKVRSWTWKDLIGGDKDHFIARAVLLLLISALAIAHTALRQYQARDTGLQFERLFELFTQGLLFVTSLAVIIWWGNQPEMGATVGEALRAFLAVESPAQEAVSSEALDAFFNTVDSLRSQAEGLNWICLVCYVVASVQLMQLAAYFHEAHPRMAILTGTVQRAFYSLFHVVMLLVLLFVFFAFVLHWMFGRSLRESETFGQAMQSQLKMLYGEYIRLPGAAGLDDDAAMAYWIHAVIFMVVAFFILRFVFLAAIVHSYAEVKEAALLKQSQRIFLVDALDALARPIRAASNNWPSENALIQWMEAGGVRDPMLRPAQLHEVFGGFLTGAKDDEAGPVDSFMVYLSTRVPEALILLEPDAGDPRFTRRRPSDAGSNSQELQGPLSAASSSSNAPRTSMLKRAGSGEYSRTSYIPKAGELDHLVPLSRHSCVSQNAFQERADGAEGKIDVKTVAAHVVHQITSQLAQSDLSEVNWLTMTGKVTSTLYREFTMNGLIHHEPAPTRRPSNRSN